MSGFYVCITYHFLLLAIITSIHASAITAAVMQTAFANLWVIPSSLDLAGAEIEMVEVAHREKRLKAALAPCRDQFDYSRALQTRNPPLNFWKRKKMPAPNAAEL